MKDVEEQDLLNINTFFQSIFKIKIFIATFL